jgi:tetratricopeptide (TPR) repeat protein
MFQRSESFWKNYQRNHVADYTRQDGEIGYEWISRYVLAFLDSYLKQDPKGAEFLRRSPTENGVPPNFMSVVYRKAEGGEPTMDFLRAEVGRRGFAHAEEVYAEIKKHAPGFAPKASEMADWAGDLAAGGHLSEAVEVLKLNLLANPDARGGYAALGDAYAQAGQKALAAESYRRQLEKTPGNLGVQEKLVKLER